ncbi:MAG: PH domain-containing protein, partial [Gemmatimonadetes bacterium]|nr:PH domain-containing protein [Gemmatimonadota bacterium]NIS36808.1 PH domain-containing protein [Actinomycetota bacterium]NIU71296.1 PH domain-containing protein [Actinomycetota bacterium]NIW33244.1 PH domain-containing protein [Actinomycetota bacterium]NIX25371.1 PH domain-containing protein [Actinomycetota bacterium]
VNALDPRIVHIWRLLGAAVALVLTLLAGLIEFTELRPGALDPIRPGTLTVAVAVVAFGIAILYPPLRYRFWRWSVEADRVVIQKGVIWRTRSLFPRVRIQHVDTRTSPL